jgi:hypothetical protein
LLSFSVKITAPPIGPGTAYKVLAGTDLAGCCAACHADGDRCLGWSLPRANGTTCRLLMGPLVDLARGETSFCVAIARHFLGLRANLAVVAINHFQARWWCRPPG